MTGICMRHFPWTKFCVFSEDNLSEVMQFLGEVKYGLTYLKGDKILGYAIFKRDSSHYGEYLYVKEGNYIVIENDTVAIYDNDTFSCFFTIVENEEENEEGDDLDDENPIPEGLPIQ